MYSAFVASLNTEVTCSIHTLTQIQGLLAETELKIMYTCTNNVEFARMSL